RPAAHAGAHRRRDGLIRAMEPKERGRLSQWRDTRGIQEPQAREMAARLEHRAKAADEATARDAYLELLGLAAGERVLDIGGGRVAVFDFDGDCFLIAHPDRELTRRIVSAQCDHSAVNGHLVRHLPGLLTELGLVDVQVRGFMPLEREAGSFYANLSERAAH